MDQLPEMDFILDAQEGAPAPRFGELTGWEMVIFEVGDVEESEG